MPLPHRQSLTSLRWTVRAVGETSLVPAAIRGVTINATVPGCIHTDLIDAGLIRDPGIGDAENEIQWVSWADWRYEAAFDADERLFAHDETDLAFDHLDTIARIELNGVEVGRAMSEFLPWRFAVREVLRPGTNHLAVTFTSPLRYVQEEAARLGARPVNGDYPAYNMIRKCASNFEWDWGPRVATCGIAGDVRVEGWSGARIDRHSISPRRTLNRWHVDVDVGVQPSAKYSEETADVRVLLAREGVTFEGEATLRARDGRCRFSFEAPFPAEWSPHSHGSPSLYDLRLDVLAPSTPASGHAPASRVVLDSAHGRSGFRIVEDSARHEPNGCFPLRINDHPVYCRGANWIPEGLFPRDRTPERVRQRLEQLKAANMNMVRVWGGGRYEPDWFYDICDELGIMVWQDFMFACACYPEEEPIRSLVEQEARHHVGRLARHPSVVLWCGGNECTWAHESWGFKEKLSPGQTWGEAYYNNVLPRVCAEVNPTVPYIPNSPFSPIEGMHPNNPDQGDTHTWEVWGDGYRTVTPRFCSEFGQQGPSNLETLRQAGVLQPSSAGDLVPPLLTARQRGPGGNKRWYDDPIAAWFRPPRDFEEWHYLAQLLQARSLQIGIEWQRVNMPRCSGSLIWQLNDAWPGLSWSLIDTSGAPKPAYYAVQRAFRDRILSIHPRDNSLWLYAVNDTDAAWTVTPTLSRTTLEGRALSTRHASFSIPPRAALPLLDLTHALGPPDDPAAEFIDVTAEDATAQWFYLPDRDLRPSPIA